ncbi:MAG: hypothetical protein V4787_03145 [Pseudomonadota bacterium]
MPSTITLIFAALSFIVTFAVARMLGKWWRKRHAAKKEEEVAKGQSRQVRRAHQRRKAGR